MAETLDMTLDDIIKNNKKSNTSSGGGGGRRREGRHGSVAGGSAGAAARAVVDLPRAEAQAAPYQPPKAPESAWQHDMYSGGGGGGGRVSAIETSTKLFSTNLDFGVSTEDVKELFSELGDLKQCFIHSDQNGRSEGTAEVIYARRGDAVAPVPTTAALGSPARAPDPSSPQEMASLPIPNELLVEIFLRLPTPADLARASAACVSFRRLATDHSFLRRFRKLHAPPLLGFIDNRSFINNRSFIDEHNLFLPALPPHPSAPAVAAAADFTFSFLPAPADWDILDVRDGRVLLDRFGKGLLFQDLVVCDPLHRRYIMLPPLPRAASVKDPRFHKPGQSWSYSSKIFLLPSPPGEEQEDEETSFRVFWMAFSETKLVVFVFSSSTGQWLAVAADLLAGYSFFSRHQCAYGCVYWPMDGNTKLVVFDTRGMEFSIADFLSPGWGGRERITIMEAGEGRLGLFSCSDDHPYDLCYTILPNDVEGFNQWQVKKTIKLDYGYCYTFIGSMEGYLLLYRTKRPLNEGPSKNECLSLDVKTLQLERVCALESDMCMLEMYTNFPPSLSSPTV